MSLYFLPFNIIFIYNTVTYPNSLILTLFELSDLVATCLKSAKVEHIGFCNSIVSEPTSITAAVCRLDEFIEYTLFCDKLYSLLCETRNTGLSTQFVHNTIIYILAHSSVKFCHIIFSVNFCHISILLEESNTTQLVLGGSINHTSHVYMSTSQLKMTSWCQK